MVVNLLVGKTFHTIFAEATDLHNSFSAKLYFKHPFSTVNASRGSDRGETGQTLDADPFISNQH